MKSDAQQKLHLLRTTPAEQPRDAEIFLQKSGKTSWPPWNATGTCVLLFTLSTLLFVLLPSSVFASEDPSSITKETLLQSGQSWDGVPYVVYPRGTPELTVLRITIPARTTMPWHKHSAPNVAYILSGDLTIEKQDGSARRMFTAGQAVPETVDTIHRGTAGDHPVDLIVFYASTPGQPLSTPAPRLK